MYIYNLENLKSNAWKNKMTFYSNPHVVIN